MIFVCIAISQPIRLGFSLKSKYFSNMKFFLTNYQIVGMAHSAQPSLAL